MNLNIKQLRAIATKLSYKPSKPTIGVEKLTAELEIFCDEVGTTIEEVAISLGFNKENDDVSTKYHIEPENQSVQIQAETGNSSNPDETPTVLKPSETAKLEAKLTEGIPTPTPVQNNVSEIVETNEIERLKSLSFTTVEAKQFKSDETKQTKEAMRLIRVRLSCNNPNKKSLPGEIFTVRNAVLPEVKKFIQFNVPTHVPQIMLNMIKEKQCQLFKQERLPNGNKVTKSHLVPEYNIEMLGPISTDEYNAIRQKQLAEGFDGV